MNSDVLGDIQRRLDALERTAARVRVGEVTGTAPLDVALGGASTSYEDVTAIRGLALEPADMVAALLWGNDLLVLGEIGATAGIVIGTNTVVWPGGSPFSNDLTVTHGCGFTPRLVVASCPTAPGAALEIRVATFTYTATTFVARAKYDLFSPAASFNIGFAWVAFA